ncbi:hypothetical protein AHF37_02589 [Paragonimus kellicotti]|nr:hypothetical protein AHF37_02589 [Paragonimus kellicotti]
MLTGRGLLPQSAGPTLSDYTRPCAWWLSGRPPGRPPSAESSRVKVTKPGFEVPGFQGRHDICRYVGGRTVLRPVVHSGILYWVFDSRCLLNRLVLFPGLF